MEKVNHVLVITLKVLQIDGNDCGHVVEFESFFLVSFEATFFKNIRVNVVNHFGSSQENVHVPFHPESQGVELKIDRVFMVIETDVRNVRPFQKHIISVDFSEIFAKNQNFRVYEAELQ